MGYVVYACNKDGSGYVQKVAEVEDLTDIHLHVGMFAPDVVISIEKEGTKPMSVPSASSTKPTALNDLKLK